MPSHRMITFWAPRSREGGRNSATICCLNLVLNICRAIISHSAASFEEALLKHEGAYNLVPP